MPLVPLSEYSDLVGVDLGFSPWKAITQAIINDFGKVTDDERPLHVGPPALLPPGFDTMIAHGLLSLSLIVSLRDRSDIPQLAGVDYALNYGFEKVRFIEPVPTGSNIRGGFRMLRIAEDLPNRIQETMQVTIHLESSERPVLVAEWISLYFMKSSLRRDHPQKTADAI
jgi:acyl dehydratase